MGHIGLGEGLDDRAGIRTPDTERGHRGRQVLQLGGAVSRKLVGEPFLVCHAMGAACHHAEVVGSQTHDREVGLETATLAEHRGVDDLADGHVHLAHRALLDHTERTGADDVEDRERGEIDHAGRLAHLQVLGVDDG